MKKEKKETILQQGVNMRISCLRPDLFPVCEATLETLLHMLGNKTIFLSLVPRYYRLFAISDI